MNIKFSLFILSILIVSCSVTSKLTKQLQTADSAYKNGNYAEALAIWEPLISANTASGKDTDVEIFENAGQAALLLGDTQKAIKYLEEAYYLESRNENVHYTLSKCYREIDNLSKEITVLESYILNFPKGKQIDKVERRLFATYIESKNYYEAVDMWSCVEKDAKSDIKILEGYYFASKEVYGEEEVDDVLQSIIKQDPENVLALEYYGLEAYKKAETRYKTELTKYNNNKTRKQYNILVKELKLVTEDYKVARDYYEKLYKTTSNKKYACTLQKIYKQLNNPQKGVVL